MNKIVMLVIFLGLTALTFAVNPFFAFIFTLMWIPKYLSNINEYDI